MPKPIGVRKAEDLFFGGKYEEPDYEAILSELDKNPDSIKTFTKIGINNLGISYKSPPEAFKRLQKTVKLLFERGLEAKSEEYSFNSNGKRLISTEYTTSEEKKLLLQEHWAQFDISYRKDLILGCLNHEDVSLWEICLELATDEEIAFACIDSSFRASTSIKEEQLGRLDKYIPASTFQQIFELVRTDGKDPFIYNFSGIAPIHRMCLHPEYVALLLKKGVDFEIKTTKETKFQLILPGDSSSTFFKIKKGATPKDIVAQVVSKFKNYFDRYNDKSHRLIAEENKKKLAGFEKIVKLLGLEDGLTELRPKDSTDYNVNLLRSQYIEICTALGQSKPETENHASSIIGDKTPLSFLQELAVGNNNLKEKLEYRWEQSLFFEDNEPREDYDEYLNSNGKARQIFDKGEVFWASGREFCVLVDNTKIYQVYDFYDVEARGTLHNALSNLIKEFGGTPSPNGSTS